MKKEKYPVYLFWSYAAFWIILAIKPVNREVWLLENIPLFIFFPLILWSYFWRQRVSNLSYTLLVIFMAIHTIGAHYTYSEAPFFSEFFGQKLQRDNYDRLAHFSFGLLMAYPLQEFLRKFIKMEGIWNYIVPLTALFSISAGYELFEWGAASLSAPIYADSFLGIQGDVWDAQKDMLLALTGALIAMSFVFFKTNKKR